MMGIGDGKPLLKRCRRFLLIGIQKPRQHYLTHLLVANNQEKLQKILPKAFESSSVAQDSKL